MNFVRKMRNLLLITVKIQEQKDMSSTYMKLMVGKKQGIITSVSYTHLGRVDRESFCRRI